MELRYCTKCLYPDTKPGLRFNEKGICDACVWAEKKDKIDWNLRKKEFEKLIEQYRCLDGSRYDCIVPVSGGKDSHFQVHVMKDLYGMNPLCVNFVPIDLIPLGRKNIENLKNQGVDYIEFTPNPKVYRKMEKYGLTEAWRRELARACWNFYGSRSGRCSIQNSTNSMGRKSASGIWR
ncbi:hypothetical protein [Candidatus Nitrosotenuis chungbukensis]|uniref:hypothetical protein n=1 Tax=Candidatus Nitrosotenuis chungbukensis TaxID=1353246 RepID=UPI002A4E24CE|nr:hypothetical protein [Candidatus Nitrosotenuis chungbukensis]